MASEKRPDGDDAGNALTRKEVETFREEIREFRRELQEMEARLEPFAERRLRDLAGQHLEGMFGSEEVTLEYLQHADPKLREAALELAYRLEDYRQAGAHLRRDGAL